MLTNFTTADRIIGVFGIILVAVVIGLSAYTWGEPSASTIHQAVDSPAATIQTPLLVGYVGTAKESLAGQPCFDSSDALDTAGKAIAAQDKIAWHQLVNQHAILFQTGDRVRGLAAGGLMFSTINVRIETGKNAGKSCWIPRESENDMKDIHEDSSSR